MLKFSKDKHAENVEREEQFDALRLLNMDLQSKSNRDFTVITKQISRDKMENEQIDFLENEVKRLGNVVQEKDKKIE